MTRGSFQRRIDEKRPHSWASRIFRCLVDVFVLNAAFRLTLMLYFRDVMWNSPLSEPDASSSIYLQLEIFTTIAWLAVALWMRLYGRQRRASVDEIRAVFRTSVTVSVAVMLFVVTRGGYNYYSRFILLSYGVGMPFVMVLVRVAIQSTASTLRSQALGKKNVLIVGTGSEASRFARELSMHPEFGYHVVGLLDGKAALESGDPLVLGTLDDFDKFATLPDVDEVILALADDGSDVAAQLVRRCEDQCIHVAILADRADDIGDQPHAEAVGDFYIVRLRETPLDVRLNRFLKRSFDIVLSLLILVTVFPIVWLATALAYRSVRGLMFLQERTGQNGRDFWCFKFRTMVPNATANKVTAQREDPRFTIYGKRLRHRSLDELPQFWNVLRGEMSVVGPRPHMLQHTEDYRRVISRYMTRHLVKPGITGWAQVNGLRGGTTNEQMQQRIEHDLYYIEHWSFFLDLLIVVRTIGSVVWPDRNSY